MNQSSAFSIIITALIFASLSSAALAQTDFFDSFNSITGGEDIGVFYAEHATWVDLIVYIFLFVYVAQFAFRGQQGMGKALPTVVGIVLAIGAMVAETQFNFNLGQLGPFALALALVVIAFTVYKAIHGMGLGGASSWAFAYIIVYGFLMSAAADLFKWADEKVPFVGSLLAIGMVIAIVAAVMAIFKWAREGGVFGGGGVPAGGAQQGAAAAQQAAQQAQQQQQQANLLQQHTNLFNQLNQQLGQLQQAIAQGAQNQAQLVQQLGGAIQQLQQVDNQIIQLLQQGP